MSIFSKIGSAVKSYAKNVVGGAKIVGSAIKNTVKNVSSSVSKSNLGAAIGNTIGISGFTTGTGKNTNKAVVNTITGSNKPAMQFPLSPGKSISSSYVAPKVTGQRNGVTYYGDVGLKELAKVESIMSPSSQKLSSSNVPSSYDAMTLDSGINGFEAPSYISSNLDSGLGSYLGASAINAGSNMGMTGSTIGATIGAEGGVEGIDTQTEEEKKLKQNQQSLIDMMNELSGVPKEKAKMEEQAGIPAATAELRDLQAKQQLQTAQYMSQMQDIQNKPIANEFIAGQQGEVQRRAGIDAMITSALIQGKSGQIQTAQNTIDQAINLKYDTITKRIDTQKAILEMNYDNLSRSDKKLADERGATLDAQKADLTQFKGIQTEAAKQAMSSGDTTAFQAIMNATSYEELGQAGGQYAPAGTFADFSTFTSTLTPTQQQNFANVPDDLKTSIQELVNGDALISDLVKSRGIQGTQQIQKLINYAQSIDPSYSINTEKQRYAFKQKWVNDNVTGSAGSKTAINTALGHLADLSEASKELPGSILKKMNSVKNILSKEFGDPAVTNFRIVLEALGSELAKVYKGGVPNEGEIRAWQESLAANFAKSQLSGAFNTTAKLLSGKLTALRYTYKSAMGKEYDQSLIDPDKRQALISAGINPNSIISENLPKATAGVIPAGGFAESW